MRCFFDNDAVLKLAELDVLDDALQVLSTERAEVWVLPTSAYVFRNKLKHAVSGSEVRHSFEGIERALEFVRSVRHLSDPPDLSEYTTLLAIPRIDAGEALLFTATRGVPEFLVITGDKNALRALARSGADTETYDRLRGRVLCFEQVIMRLFNAVGFETVRERAVPAARCDGALGAVFSSGIATPEQAARQGLNRYISRLWEETGLLVST